MDSQTKRQLLNALLAGKTEGLQAYKLKSQQQGSEIRWVINSTPVGGPIEIIYLDYTRREITVEEFAKLSPSLTVWSIVDHSDGEPIPNVDDDYNSPNEPSPL